MKSFIRPAALFLFGLSFCLSVSLFSQSKTFLDDSPEELMFFPGMIPFVSQAGQEAVPYLEYYGGPDLLPLVADFNIIEDYSYVLEEHPYTGMGEVFLSRYFYACRSMTDIELQGIYNLDFERLKIKPSVYRNIGKRVFLPEEEVEQQIDVTMRDALPEGFGKIGFDLPLESKLEISGRKGVTVNYGNVVKTNPPAGSINNSVSAGGITNGFTLTQDLQVRLTGTIGKRVTVNVDYDDTKEQQRDISLIYKGEADEFIQKAEFGDVTLSLPNTEFTGYNKRIFGGDIEMKLGPLNIKAIGAQTKGKTDIDRFVGGFTPVKLDIYDTNFIRNRYYILNNANIDPGSVQIWMDDQNGTNNNFPAGYPPDRGADPTLFTQKSSPLGTYALDYLHPGTDYTVDYKTGIVTFNKSIQSNYTLAVAYTHDGGIKAGYDGLGNFDFTLPEGTPPARNLIQPLLSDAAYYDNQLMNYYSLGNKKILLPQYDPDFVFKIYDNNNIEQPLSNYAYAMDVDNGLIKIQTSAGNDKPFSYITKPDAYPTVINPTTQSRYRIHVEYKYKINSFQLKHFGIVKNSEVVTVAGNKFTRDVQYSIDYETGFIFFFNQEEIADKEVIVTYEYSPFGGSGQSNLFGARAELNLSPFTIGSTYLFSGSQTPLDVPSVGATPTALNVLDIDSKFTITNDMISSVFGRTWLLPTEINLSGEIAKSFFDPDTYSAKNGEKGVAMIDSMEGTDNVSAFPIVFTSWFPASVPSEDPTLKPNTADILSNNRSRLLLSNIDGYGHDTTTTATRQLLKMDYDFSSGIWGAVRYPVSVSGADYSRYRFIEVWMQADWTQDVNVNLDLGVISEDTNNNSLPDTEDVNNNNVLDNGEDTGLPVSYASGTFNEGAANNLLDKEDMDNNGRLDITEQYYYYSFNLSNANAQNFVANTVTTSSGTWKLLKIPLAFDTTGKIGTPSNTLIKHARLWLKSTSGMKGSTLIESVQLTGNKWELNNVATTSTFNIKAISKDIDPSYVPLTDTYFTVVASADIFKEQSVTLTYTGSTDSYYASKLYSRPQNFMDYNVIRCDVFKRNTFPGDIVFLRIGSDENNYFQYNLSLDSVGSGWQQISASLTSPDKVVGSFFLNNIKEISMGVISSGTGGEVWVNNLRLADSIKTEGTAERLSGSVKYGDTLMASVDYKNMESRFTLFENASANTAISLTQANQSVKQSVRYTAASGTFKPVGSIPINFTYRKDEILTDDADKTNPNFLSFPERLTETYTGNVGLNFLAPFTVSIDGGYKEDTAKFLPGAVNADDTFSKSFNMSSRAAYSLPSDILGIPLGKNDVEANFRFSEEKTAHELLTSNNTYTITRENTYKWSGGYEFIPGVPLNPTYSLRFLEKKGNIFSYNPSVSIGTNPYVDNFTPQTSSRNVGMIASFTKFPGMTPRVNYAGDLERDYNINQLRTTNSIEIASEFRLAEWFKALESIAPTLNLSHRIAANAQYDKYDGDDTSPIRNLQTMDEWGLLPAESLALNSSQVITDNGSGRLKFGPISLNPRGSISSERNRQSLFLTRTGIFSIGSGMVMDNPPIPLLGFLKPVSLNVDYDYKNIKRYDSSDALISNSFTHTGNITSPFRISDDFNGSLSFSTTIEDRMENNILYQNRTYTPGIDVNQNLVFHDPIKLPDFWPFNGAVVKIDQAIRMNYKVNVAMVRNLSTGSSLNTQLNTDSYNAGTTVQYSFSRNIRADLGVQLTYFLDNISSVNNYFGYGLNLKVSAVF